MRKTDLVAASVADLITKILTAKKAEELSFCYIEDATSRGSKFATAFHCIIFCATA